MSRDDLRRLGLHLAGRALPATRPPREGPRRFLLIRPDHLGDVLLTSPAVAALRAALPEAHLTLLVGPWSEEVARRGAEVDEILPCLFPGFSRRPKRDPLQPYRILLHEARRLRGSFDLAVVFRPDHWWGALLSAAAGVPLRLGWDTPTTRPLLTEALPLPPSTHVARLNLDLAERVAEIAGGQISRDDVEPVFRIAPEERAWASGLLDWEAGPVVLLHPGSGSPLKSWPAYRWAVVADALVARGARVILSGSADERGGAAAVGEAMRQEALVLAGQTTIGQLGALAECCALALGADSGPLHLAAALGRPTVRLYGPTDEALFGPWPTTDEHLALTHELACRPCGNLLSPPCGAQQEPPCLLGIEPDRVLEAALIRLGTPSNPAAERF